MNIFEKALEEYLGEHKLKKIKNVKVGIAGAGGLGSNCAFNLVRSGFQKIKIVDFDVVEPSNLDRQFYFIDQIGLPKVEALKINLLKINPDLELDTVNERICESNAGSMFKDCDAVVEAFDKVNCKTLLVESYADSGKLLVCASGLAGWGQSDDIKIRKIREGFYIVGDMASEVGRGKPPISPRVNIAAAKQADIILSYVLERGE